MQHVSSERLPNVSKILQRVSRTYPTVNWGTIVDEGRLLTSDCALLQGISVPHGCRRCPNLNVQYDEKSRLWF